MPFYIRCLVYLCLAWTIWQLFMPFHHGGLDQVALAYASWPFLYFWWWRPPITRSQRQIHVSLWIQRTAEHEITTAITAETPPHWTTVVDLSHQYSEQVISAVMIADTTNAPLNTKSTQILLRTYRNTKSATNQWNWGYTSLLINSKLGERKCWLAAKFKEFRMKFVVQGN